MEAVFLAVAVVVIAAAHVINHRVWAHHIRDELSANRMERAELLQRIQAPERAATPAFPTSPGVFEVQPDLEDVIEREWEASEDSLIPFDEDLGDDYQRVGLDV